MATNQMLGGSAVGTIPTTLGSVGGGIGGGGGGSGAPGASGPTGPTGPVAGSDTQVVFNRAGAAGATGALTFNYTSGTLTTSALVVTNNATISGNLLFPTVNVFTVSGTSLTLTTASAGSYYSLINSGFSSLSLPSPVPTMAGTFWTLRNATSSYLSVTVANNLNLATPLILSSSNNTTIVVSVSGVNGATISGYVLF